MILIVMVHHEQKALWRWVSDDRHKHTILLGALSHRPACRRPGVMVASLSTGAKAASVSCPDDRAVLFTALLLWKRGDPQTKLAHHHQVCNARDISANVKVQSDQLAKVYGSMGQR